MNDEPDDARVKRVAQAIAEDNPHSKTRTDIRALAVRMLAAEERLCALEARQPQEPPTPQPAQDRRCGTCVRFTRDPSDGAPWGHCDPLPQGAPRPFWYKPYNVHSGYQGSEFSDCPAWAARD